MSRSRTRRVDGSGGGAVRGPGRPYSKGDWNPKRDKPSPGAPMTVSWRGVFPAATTEFTADQALDLPATARHIDAMIRAGVHGMIVLGTVGENCSLDYREKLDVLRAAREAIG